jgi:hypothetical protein
MYSILVHIANQEPVKLDVEELPKPTDNCIIGKNPRDRSDRELAQIDEGVTTVIYPWHRISYIQVLPSGEDNIEFPLLYRD